jgi:phosphoglycolate phosphatase
MRKHLLWDLDGTLTDPQEGIVACIQHALRSSNKTVPSHEELLWCIGPPLHHSFRQLNPGATEEETHRLVELYRERFSTKGIHENKLFPGIQKLLERLPDHKHYLATSKPLVFASEILRNFKIDRHFTGIYGSELGGALSEKPELIAHILKKENIPKNDVVMIGDRKFDVLGAKAVGILCIGILWGYGSREELENAGADYLVETEEALGDLLLKA